MHTEVAVSHPETFHIALHCLARGDLLLPQPAEQTGEWLTARFILSDIALKTCSYYDSVSLYGSNGACLELIALNAPRHYLLPGDPVCIRIKVGT